MAVPPHGETTVEVRNCFDGGKEFFSWLLVSLVFQLGGMHLTGLDTCFKWTPAEQGTSKALPMAKRSLSLRGANKKWQLAFYNAVVVPCGYTASQSGCTVVHGI